MGAPGRPSPSLWRFDSPNEVVTGDPAVGPHFDRHEVEAHAAALKIVPPDVLIGRRCKPGETTNRNRFLGRTVCARPPALDLDENQIPALARHDIQLPTSKADVAIDDLVPQTMQDTDRPCLPEPAQGACHDAKAAIGPKLRRCSGEIPSSASAARWPAVP